MPGPVASIVWYSGLLLEVGFVVCSIWQKSFFRYFFLNLYFLLTLASGVGRYFALTEFGQSSDQYRFVYFYTDVLLTLALYVAIISLFSRILGELEIAKYVRLTAVFLLLGTALFSYGVVAQSEQRLATMFAYELSQNLYFVGLVLTYILWGAILKLRETRTRLVQFVLALGVYFSAYAASYALVNLASKYSVVHILGPIVSCLLPLSWTVTMWRHSEEARLMPARLLAVQR
jgi:hypothetical protein